ncbi:MAG: FHA domain-containing protein, partial [Acutalibacteraceae bacterium]
DKKKDKLVLMTFGASVQTLLKGGESDAAIEEAFNSIKCNSGNTTFYTALNKVFTDSQKETDYERKFAVVVSDGADLDKGNSSQQEVVDNYESHRLPIYAMCQSRTEKSSGDGFGYIARISGGELVTFSSSDAESRFSTLKSYFENVTLFKLESSSKKSAGFQKLVFDLDGEEVSEDVEVMAKADNKAPTVKSIEFDKDTNSFKITFSEEVDHADKISSFKVKKGDKEFTIVSVSYKSKVATLNMEKTVYSGEYTFELSSITDSSDNANKLSKSTYTEEITAKPIILKVLSIVGIILIPVLFLLAIFLILLFMKKKKKVTKIKDIFITQVEEEQHQAVHIQEKKGLAVKFYVDSADGTFHKIDYNLISSLIVGRSDMCDLRIDDSRLSRQHFAIEQVEKGLAVTDLGSINGTFVNGVQIRSRTFVRSGDRISAGNSVIRVVYNERDVEYALS